MFVVVVFVHVLYATVAVAPFQYGVGVLKGTQRQWHGVVAGGRCVGAASVGGGRYATSSPLLSMTQGRPIAAAVAEDACMDVDMPLISSEDVRRISHGGVVTLPGWVPPPLIAALRSDARELHGRGQFRPDGLTNTALLKSTPEAQGFSVAADRQTFRGGAGWEDYDEGDGASRKEFATLMRRLRMELALGLHRPTLAKNNGNGGGADEVGGGSNTRHEMTYNWYDPGAKLGRHLDEHHEETKGTQGWIRPSRRSITWLVYLNDNWQTDEEGGTLRCFPRSEEHISMSENSEEQGIVPVGAHEGNLQVGWIQVEAVEGGISEQQQQHPQRCSRHHPVFLDCFRPSGRSALYRVATSTAKSADEQKIILSEHDFDVPPQPIEFANFLPQDIRETFEQISTSRLDPRFAARPDPNPNNSLDDKLNWSKGDNDDFAPTMMDKKGMTTILDVTPTAGMLVLFDSVTLPHLVQEVTGSRPRIAATGWFHEDSQFVLEI